MKLFYFYFLIILLLISTNQSYKIKNAKQFSLENSEFDSITTFLEKTNLNLQNTQSFDLFIKRLIKMRKKKEIIIKKVYEIFPLVGELLALSNVEKINLIVNRFFIERETDLIRIYITMLDGNANSIRQSAKVLLNLILCNNKFNRLRCILNLLMEGLCQGDDRSIEIFKEIVVTMIIDTVLKTKFYYMNDLHAKLNLIKVFNKKFKYSTIAKIKFVNEMLLSDKLKEILTFTIMRLRNNLDVENECEKRMSEMPPLIDNSWGNNIGNNKSNKINLNGISGNLSASLNNSFNTGGENISNNRNYGSNLNLQSNFSNSNSNLNSVNNDSSNLSNLLSNTSSQTINSSNFGNSLNNSIENSSSLSNLSNSNSDSISNESNQNFPSTTSSLEARKILENMKTFSIKDLDSTRFKEKLLIDNEKEEDENFKYEETKIIDTEHLEINKNMKIKLYDIKEEIRNEYSDFLYKHSLDSMPMLEQFDNTHQVGINLRSVYPKYRKHITNLIRLNELLDQFPPDTPIGSVDVSSPIRVKTETKTTITKEVAPGINFSMQFKEKNVEKNEGNTNPQNISKKPEASNISQKENFRFKSMNKLKAENLFLKVSATTPNSDFASQSFELLTNDKIHENSGMIEIQPQPGAIKPSPIINNNDFNYNNNFNANRNNNNNNFNLNNNKNNRNPNNYNDVSDNNSYPIIDDNNKRDYNKDDLPNTNNYNANQLINGITTSNKNVKVLFPKEIHTEYQVDKLGKKTITINTDSKFI